MKPNPKSLSKTYGKSSAEQLKRLVQADEDLVGDESSEKEDDWDQQENGSLEENASSLPKRQEVVALV